MFSECSFKDASIPDLITQIEKDIGEYGAKKNRDVLKEIPDLIAQARVILNRSLTKANENDRKRLKDIEDKRQKIEELKKRFEIFNRG